jgi:iduronate 2-sulfatase
MGYSMRTDRWRYTEWRKGDEAVARELYDHQADADEDVNLSNDAEHRATVDEMGKQLRAGWRAAGPRATT